MLPLRLFLVLALMCPAAPIFADENRATVVAATDRFEFHSNPRVALHLFLIAWAAAGHSARRAALEGGGRGFVGGIARRTDRGPSSSGFASRRISAVLRPTCTVGTWGRVEHSASVLPPGPASGLQYLPWQGSA